MRDGALERVNWAVLQNHLETCVATAMREGRTEETVEALMDVLRDDRVATGPAAGKASR